MAGLWFLNSYAAPAIASNTEGETGIVMDGLLSAASSVDKVLPSPLTEARNAVAARKIEEFVVPHTQLRLNKRPRIAIIFGARHAGMESCLQCCWWRDKVIGFYEGIGYSGLEKGQLNRVYEVFPSNTGEGNFDILGLPWKSENYDCALFEV